MADDAPVVAPPAEGAPPSSLSQVALLFLRLGVTAFGGPAAHIAIMENEVVRRRRWLAADRFLDLLGAANLIPGPSSSELAIYIGYEQAGWQGLVVAGSCFILPAALLTAVIARAYVRHGALPQVGGALYGIKPAVIALVVQALWRLAPKAIKRSKLLGALGILACIASAMGLDPVLVLVGAGVACAAVRGATSNGSGARGFGAPIVTGLAGGAATAALNPVSLLTLFLTFLKFGAVVFGSGYVLLAFIHADLVDRLHWLTESQLLDAIAVGQVTPGPVFTTATFVGYVVAGGWGAVVATVAIFLPGFLVVAATRPFVAFLRRSSTAAGFLDGVNVASLSLMAVVTWQLMRTAVVDPTTAVIVIASVLVLVTTRLNSAWLIIASGLIGVLRV